VEEQAKLVGGCLTAGGAVGGEMTLPGLDMIFGTAAPAIDILVQRFRSAAGEIGDDESGVGSGLAGFNACDDALDAPPACCAIVELLEAAQFGCLRTCLEAGEEGTDTRFIVTNLEGGRAKKLYQDLYCRRGVAENHIKSWKRHLAADRTSCSKATANQFRLFLHAGAYWLLWALRAAMPKRSAWRVAQFDTLRLRLVKIAVRVVEMKTQIRLHLPSACPYQAILRTVLEHLPRLIA
jgi:hypothetical protein